jgi:hypothetical protein
MGGLQVHLDGTRLRRAGFAMESILPGGIERLSCGRLTRDDLDWLRERLQQGLQGSRARAARQSLDGVEALRGVMRAHHADSAVYLAREEYGLPDRIRSAAIEIDFVFGDRDGSVGLDDLGAARQRYALLRGPIAWNRLLVADEVERALFPGRVLNSTEGPRLEPHAWLSDGPDRLAPLRRLLTVVDDATLARTYANAAARSETLGHRERDPEHHRLLREGMMLMGQEMSRRRSVRPTLSDIARIGRSDPGMRLYLDTALQMSRRLHPDRILTPFFAAPT